ncbi:MAG: hypothetical protein AMJ92_02935 [candidate division Zixibacteria bacterium SM23_81]|nr:MAG: hypothetical protein AMJ92_02935 [candidate division Zixibacteria bacterium SM23_81]
MAIKKAQENYPKSIYALMIFRLILITLILGAAILFLAGRSQSFSLTPIYGLLVLTYVISGFYWLAAKLEVAPTLLVTVQLSIDVALVTGILYYSGGSESILTLLYLLIIISSTMFVHLGGILYICTLAAAAYGLLSWLQYHGIWETISFFYPDRLPRPPEQLSINVYLNICFFYLVAVLSGFLAEKLRQKGEELESTSRKLRKVLLDTDDILENMNSGLITLDGEGRILHFNRAAESILSLDSSQIKGKLYQQVFEEVSSELSQVLRSALEEGLVNSRTEIAVVSRNGHSIPVGISTTLLGMDEGERGGVIAVFQDLTEAKKLERKVRQADRLSVLGQLSAGIAHEIRNPLTTISGSIEVLRESLKLAGEERKLMGLITRESDRLNRIITDFLLYARIRPADKTVVDIGKVMDETLTIVRNHADFHDGIEMTNALKSQTVCVLADQDQVKQIFLNITINAVQAMPRGGKLTVGLVEGQPTARPRANNGMVRIFFRDTGSGIPAGELKNIFEPFFSSKKGGTGLGLSIAQRIVQNNGGELEVESQVGSGTTFIVSLFAAGEFGEKEDEKKERN